MFESNHITISRRELISAGAASAAMLLAPESWSDPAEEPIIDIHQHTNYSGRTDEQLLQHQRTMGVTQTILLPAGTPVDRPSTDNGRSNGLAANCGGNESCMALAKSLPREYLFFANEVSDLPDATRQIEKYLKLGAKGIGEQKFNLDCDSPAMHAIAELAQRRRVPILMHFQYDNYNKHFERFYTMLEKYPKVRFVGHAQTWWANIDKDW